MLSIIGQRCPRKRLKPFGSGYEVHAPAGCRNRILSGILELLESRPSGDFRLEAHASAEFLAPRDSEYRGTEVSAVSHTSSHNSIGALVALRGQSMLGSLGDSSYVSGACPSIACHSSAAFVLPLVRCSRLPRPWVCKSDSRGVSKVTRWAVYRHDEAQNAIRTILSRRASMLLVGSELMLAPTSTSEGSVRNCRSSTT